MEDRCLDSVVKQLALLAPRALSRGFPMCSRLLQMLQRLEFVPSATLPLSASPFQLLRCRPANALGPIRLVVGRGTR